MVRLPQPNEITGRTVAEYIAVELHELYGPVVTRDVVADFSSTFGFQDRYVRDALNLLAAYGLVEHVCREVWVLTWFVEEQELEALAIARAACSALGTWAVPTGAWALELAGLLPEHEIDTSISIRACTTWRPHRPTSSTGRGSASRDAAIAVKRLPDAAIGRRVTVVSGTPIAVIHAPANMLVPVSPIDLPGGIVHVVEPYRAAASMFQHVRIAGGFNSCMEQLAIASPALDPTEFRVAIATHSCAVRRRAAHAISLLVRAGRVEPAWSLPRAMCVPDGRTITPLDPHRLPIGPICRACAIRDNRLAAVRTAEVAVRRPARAGRIGPADIDLQNMPDDNG